MEQVEASDAAKCTEQPAPPGIISPQVSAVPTLLRVQALGDWSYHDRDSLRHGLVERGWKPATRLLRKLLSPRP